MSNTRFHWSWDLPIRRECSGSRTCGICGICRMAEYNQKKNRLAPLEQVGTSRYFRAVSAAFHREAESRARKRNGHKPKPVPRWKGPVDRRKMDDLHPQLCHGCTTELPSGTKVFAADKWPIVLCEGCAERFEEKKKFRMNMFLSLVPAMIGS